MLMVRGEMWACMGFSGDSGASCFSLWSLDRAVNVILMFVLGKRNVHLKNNTQCQHPSCWLKDLEPRPECGSPKRSASNVFTQLRTKPRHFVTLNTNEHKGHLDQPNRKTQGRRLRKVSDTSSSDYASERNALGGFRSHSRLSEEPPLGVRGSFHQKCKATPGSCSRNRQFCNFLLQKNQKNGHSFSFKK